MITYRKHELKFKIPGGTSRGILTKKPSWILEISNSEDPNKRGIGECSVIPGLSPEYVDDKSYEKKLDELCSNPRIDLREWPSIQFGLETAMLDLANGGRGLIFSNRFINGESIPINGLIWMGDEDFMRKQIDEKIMQGFSTLKMKVGIDFETELKILKDIRNRYSIDDLILRVDANGAFEKDAIQKLDALYALGIHSIEQPIRAGQIDEMKNLCKVSRIPIALDEELIGVIGDENKRKLIQQIRPQFIILKPSLHGGIKGCKKWIEIAESNDVGWWITSALESNIGLNAICQFTCEYENHLPQGLGTGSLFVNNFDSRLEVKNGQIFLKSE